MHLEKKKNERQKNTDRSGNGVYKYLKKFAACNLKKVISLFVQQSRCQKHWYEFTTCNNCHVVVIS